MRPRALSGLGHPQPDIISCKGRSRHPVDPVPPDQELVCMVRGRAAKAYSKPSDLSRLEVIIPVGRKP